MEFSLFPITGIITWIFWELSLANKENPLACPIAVSRGARKISDFFDRYSAFGRCLTLDPCFEDEINKYILLDVLLCSITEYFYELYRILTSP